MIIENKIYIMNVVCSGYIIQQKCALYCYISNYMLVTTFTLINDDDFPCYASFIT